MITSQLLNESIQSVFDDEDSNVGSLPSRTGNHGDMLVPGEGPEAPAGQADLPRAPALAWHAPAPCLASLYLKAVYSVCLKTRLLHLGKGRGPRRALPAPYTDGHITPLSSAATCRMQGTENHGLRLRHGEAPAGGWGGCS